MEGRPMLLNDQVMKVLEDSYCGKDLESVVSPWYLEIRERHRSTGRCKSSCSKYHNPGAVKGMKPDFSDSLKDLSPSIPISPSRLHHHSSFRCPTRRRLYHHRHTILPSR